METPLNILVTEPAPCSRLPRTQMEKVNTHNHRILSKSNPKNEDEHEHAPNLLYLSKNTISDKSFKTVSLPNKNNRRAPALPIC